MVNQLKHGFNLNYTPLPDLLITLKEIVFEKLLLSDMQNHKTVCYQVDCQ